MTDASMTKEYQSATAARRLVTQTIPLVGTGDALVKLREPFTIAIRARVARVSPSGSPRLGLVTLNEPIATVTELPVAGEESPIESSREVGAKLQGPK
jgi:hypothetical protein